MKISVGLILTASLVAAVIVPVVLSRPGDIVFGILVLPLVATAFATRLAFQTLAGHFLSRRHRGPGLVAASSITALGSGAVLLGFSAAVGHPIPAAAVAASLAATFTTLAIAGAGRALEVKLGASSRRIFFLGSAAQRADLTREVGRRGDLRVVGECSPEKALQCPSDELAGRIAATKLTTLVMSAEAVRDEQLVAAASELHLTGVRVRALNDFYEKHFAKVPVSDLSRAWFLFDIAEVHRPRIYGTVKRIYESGVAAGLLVLALPALPVIALAVKISSSGPVLYRQQRIGINGKLITLTKFRTMTTAPADGEQAWATAHVTRITSVGRWLRKFRLDELPQLWHVVRGDLALVGPRPEQPQIVARLQESIDFYYARHRVRPGLTGWAQVNHGYGGSMQDTLEKLQFEFWYIKHQSLRLDLLILFATVRTIVLGGGR